MSQNTALVFRNFQLPLVSPIYKCVNIAVCLLQEQSVDGMEESHLEEVCSNFMFLYYALP